MEDQELEQVLSPLTRNSNYGVVCRYGHGRAVLVPYKYLMTKATARAQAVRDIPVFGSSKYGRKRLF